MIERNAQKGSDEPNEFQVDDSILDLSRHHVDGSTVTTNGDADMVDDGDVQRAMWAVGEAHRRRGEGGDDVDIAAEPEPQRAPEVPATEPPSEWFG